MNPTTNQQKGCDMRNVYIRRRITVVVIPLLAALVLWGGVTKAPVNVFVKAYDTITTPAPEPTCVITSVTVKEGDTLWGIAERYCPDHFRTGETVSKIVAINGGIVNIRVGQVINLPFKEGK
jgi:nucleoid-associated protein YgaU